MNVKYLMFAVVISISALSCSMQNPGIQDSKMISNHLSILLNCRSFAQAHILLNGLRGTISPLQIMNDSGNTLFMHYLQQLDKIALTHYSLKEIIRCREWWIILFFLRMHYGETVTTVDTMRNKAGETARDLINGFQNHSLRAIITELVQNVDAQLPPDADMFYYYTYQENLVIICGMESVFKPLKLFTFSEKLPDEFPESTYRVSADTLEKARKFGIYKGAIITVRDGMQVKK